MYTNQTHAYVNAAPLLTDLFCTVYHSAQCPLMQSVTVGSRPANISQTARCQDDAEGEDSEEKDDGTRRGKQIT